ncbi:hypothetical protein QT228_18780, partial [Escherichia coli]|nr:hypothetical protein [Escherichia coli]
TVLSMTFYSIVSCSFFLLIRTPPSYTYSSSSAASMCIRDSNKYARDFHYFSSVFAINREDLLKNYQEIRASIKDYDDLLREIKELTIKRDKSVDDKRTLFDNKRDKWNSQEVQDEVAALNQKIADDDNKIRSNLNIVKNHRRENQYKANKNISNAMLNILDWFERYPDIVKNINQA